MCQFQNRRPFDLETLNFQFGDKIYQWMCTFRHTHTHRPKIFYSKSIYPFLNRISAGIFTVFGLRVQCMSYWHLVPFIVYKTVLLKKKICILQGSQEVFRRCFYILSLTGKRRSNTSHLRWFRRPSSGK